MKRIIVLFIVFCIAGSLFALEEVRGIQTRKISNSGDYSTCYEFEFTNENSFPVSVEAEVYFIDDNLKPFELRNTKNFNLAAKETYSWNVGICKHFTKDRAPYVKYRAYKR